MTVRDSAGGKDSLGWNIFMRDTATVKHGLDSGLVAYYPFNGNANDARLTLFTMKVDGRGVHLQIQPWLPIIR